MRRQFLNQPLASLGNIQLLIRNRTRAWPYLQHEVSCVLDAAATAGWNKAIPCSDVNVAPTRIIQHALNLPRIRKRERPRRIWIGRRSKKP